ncbi:hypothetical protein ACSFBX_13630 [Variovorax sp. RB2P76]|uniref:hypothetical protein n=1 Tax=Variovorax sp. RB2P76 TaxID=3443736 RepID=UPI003F4573A3
MRQRHDANDEELKILLEALLTEDVDVTAREIARRHSSLKNASAFTRSESRTQLISAARQRQAEIRRAAQNIVSTTASADELALRTAEVKKLERQVRNLVAAHAGLIRAVQLAGGMNALSRFWKDYKAIADEVHALDAVPALGTVTHLQGKRLTKSP